MVVKILKVKVDFKLRWILLYYEEGIGSVLSGGSSRRVLLIGKVIYLVI